jgi:membrane protease YdiL (CAAX protease family)
VSRTDLVIIGLLLAVAGLLLLANYGERFETARILSFIASGLMAGIALTFGLLGLLVVSVRQAAGDISAADARTALLASLSLLVAGAAGLLLFIPGLQRALARAFGRSTNSSLAHLVAVLLLIFLAVQLPFAFGGPPQGIPPITSVDILAQDVPLVVIAFIGIGLLARRSFPEAVQRLGLLPPKKARWWLVALLAIPAFIGIATGIDAVGNFIAPASQRQVSNVSTMLFSQFNTVPAVVFLGLTAGVAEEVLFRGAMLPRFGVLITALLFAAVHTQYAATFATLEVFVLGLGLGWLRRAGGTLPAIVTHAGYDITVGILSLHH